MSRNGKDIIDEINSIFKRKPFDFEEAENLITQLDLEKAPTELETILLNNINNKEDDARIFAYEYLYYFDSEHVFQAALKGTSDEEELVKINAIEILGSMPRRESLPYLEKALNSSDSLVRCYAAESIGYVGTGRAKVLLEERLNKETDSFARLGLYSALYNLGEKEMLECMIGLLDDDNYLTVIRSLENLSAYVDKTNKEYISKNIDKLLQHKIPVSVREKAENSLNEIESI
ncbi:HEAT repeat domain-containing protein [Listeria welshimeri]|nr:HEAT repeat domain-containing protein [Listeria welshimeri]